LKEFLSLTGTEMISRWAILALLFLVRSCMGFQFQSVPAVSPLFLKDFGIGIADIGLLIGLYHAPGIALAIPGGGLGRRYGDTAVVAFGLLLMFFGAVMMSVSATWPSQIAGRLVSGIGAVMLNVLMSKMVTDWFAGKEIATAMGIFVNSWPFGIAIGLLVFPSIVASGGLVAAQVAVAVVIGIALLALLTLYRGPHHVAAGAPAMASAWPQATARRAVLTVGLVWGFYNAALGVVFGFGPLILTERGWTLAAASSATSIALWLVVVSVPLGGVIADRTGRHIAVLTGGCVVFALALLVAGRTDATVASFAALGLLSGLAAGPIMSLPSRVLQPETRALGMGLFFTMFYVMQAAGPWIAGRASAAAGHAAMAFDVGVLFLVMALALVWIFLKLAERSVLTEPRRVNA
jgi:MFS family permease